MTNDPISDKYAMAPETLALPDSRSREGTSVADLGKWLVIGEAWSHIAAHRSPCARPSYVDIGCGYGKMARFLTLDRGCSYLGMDLDRGSIEWCQNAFSRHPTFRFEHLDIASPIANPDGVLDPTTVNLPVAGRSADMVICASLFTHLIEPVFIHYMSEVERVLSPIGRALISIHNEPVDGKFSGDVPRIDISEAYFKELVEASGLIVVERVGFVLGQILFVIGRPGDDGKRFASKDMRPSSIRSQDVVHRLAR